MRKKITIALKILLCAALFVWISSWFTTKFVQPWLWMQQMGYSQIFWGVLSIKWPLAGITFALVFVYTWFNLRYANRVIATPDEGTVRAEHFIGLFEVPHWLRMWGIALIAIGLSWLSASIISPQWKLFLNYRWGGSFGQVDPIFGRDIGFYVFSLPFYQMLQSNIMRLLSIQFVLILFAYMDSGCIRVSRKKPWLAERRIAGHLSLHLVLGLCILAWGFYLRHFALIYNPTGVVYGIGYTADHVLRKALVIMALLALLSAAVIATAFLVRRYKTIILTIFAITGIYIALVSILPTLVQTYKVEPSELRLETPYLKNNIAFTRKAFQLENVEVKTYPAPSNLSEKDLVDNEDVIDNISVWDSRSLLPTLRQTQEMRLYYQFYNADVDRYHLSDGYKMVMLSARELAPTLPQKAQTWVNRRLQFTHGYGLVMNFDSKKEVGGLPKYIINDIPPKSAYGLQMDQPAIYYGEMMPGFRIVDTGVKEFDYPKGESNVYTHYQGTGGVPLDSLAKRMVFALAQGDINILLSSYLAPDSRIQIWRRIRERVRAVAPFLTLDNNPYPVLSKGKLYWIQDAYTVLNRFPYTAPRSSAVGRVSYIRNSVKAIVDAYNGTVQFYVVDSHDPVLNAYSNAFPGAFKPLSALSDDLKQHLRYPKALFTLQSEVFKAYHMTAPQVFYNQEDLWNYPLQTRPGTPRRGATGRLSKHAPPETMKPYYLLMNLPGDIGPQFVLMASFTPQNRDNMIAWMAAKCDYPGYGNLTVYELPKERLSYGPAQVQSMINQNTLISQQLSLWDQKGSHVISGNLIAVPLADSFLYVEPVYLTSQGLNLPQLKRVIAVQGDRVVMAPTLREAVEKAVGVIKSSSKGNNQPASRLEQQIRSMFNRTKQFMKENNWQDFGKAMTELQRIIGSQAKLPATPLPFGETGKE